MQWMVPESRLGQEQTLILNQCLRAQIACSWIQGFAGSGKTVLLVHAIEQLLAQKSSQSVCFVTFTHALKDLVSTGMSDRAKHVPVLTVDRFIRNGEHYDIVLVDEIQDLEEGKLRRLKSLSGRLIVAGDVDQSIYAGGLSTEEINRELVAPEIHKLTVLYRLTQRLLAVAKSLLPGSSITGAKVQRQQDTDIVLAKAASKLEETEWVVTKATMLARAGKPALIILPRKEDIFDFIEAVAEHRNIDIPDRTSFKATGPRASGYDWDMVNGELANSDLPIRYLGNRFGNLPESDQKPLVFLMTYHSAKGLDFPHVFLPRMDSSVKLWRDDDELERRLFFVGVTRSRENLFISYSSSEPHPLVRSIPPSTMRSQSCAVTRQAGSTTDLDDLF